MPSARRVPTNETIETYNSAGGANYTSFATWEALRDVDLVATTTSYGLRVTGVGPHNTSASVSGSVSNSIYWRRVFADPSVKHTGSPGTGASFINGSAATFSLAEEYSQLQDIEVTTSAAPGNVDIFRLNSNGAAIIGCIASDYVDDGAVSLNTTGIVYAIDCLFVRGINAIKDSSTGSLYARNVTIKTMSGQGVQGDGVIAINCITQGCVTAGYHAAVSTTTCLSDDATGDIQATLTFVDADNDNYRLTASDTAAIGSGTDLSAAATYPFDDDIVGETRVAPWDIGAFKYIDPVLPVDISETALASDAFTVAVSMAHQLQEMALAGDLWAQNIIANLMFTEGAVASDTYAQSLSASLSISEIALTSDTWIGRLYASATISEIALASDMFNTFSPAERGMIHAIIRIMPAITARIDINKHYNE
jgi:hypothetical protein